MGACCSTANCSSSSNGGKKTNGRVAPLNTTGVIPHDGSKGNGIASASDAVSISGGRILIPAAVAARRESRATTTTTGTGTTTRTTTTTSNGISNDGGPASATTTSTGPNGKTILALGGGATAATEGPTEATMAVPLHLLTRKALERNSSIGGASDIDGREAPPASPMSISRPYPRAPSGSLPSMPSSSNGQTILFGHMNGIPVSSDNINNSGNGDGSSGKDSGFSTPTNLPTLRTISPGASMMVSALPSPASAMRDIAHPSTPVHARTGQFSPFSLFALRFSELLCWDMMLLYHQIESQSTQLHGRTLTVGFGQLLHVPTISLRREPTDSDPFRSETIDGGILDDGLWNELKKIAASYPIVGSHYRVTQVLDRIRDLTIGKATLELKREELDIELSTHLTRRSMHEAGPASEIPTGGGGAGGGAIPRHMTMKLYTASGREGLLGGGSIDFSAALAAANSSIPSLPPIKAHHNEDVIGSPNGDGRSIEGSPMTPSSPNIPLSRDPPLADDQLLELQKVQGLLRELAARLSGLSVCISTAIFLVIPLSEISHGCPLCWVGVLVTSCASSYPKWWWLTESIFHGRPFLNRSK
jgi:hypothetical protein